MKDLPCVVSPNNPVIELKIQYFASSGGVLPQQAPVVIENIPAGIPHTIVIATGDDVQSVVSDLPGTFAAEDVSSSATSKKQIETTQTSLFFTEAMMKCYESDESMRLTREKATQNYLSTKAFYGEQGKKVPKGVLQTIIMAAAAECNLSPNDAGRISCGNIRNRARLLMKKRQQIVSQR